MRTMEVTDKDFAPEVGDRIINCHAFNPHDHDFTYRRPDGTIYVEEIRKGKDHYYYTPEAQLSLKLE